MRIRTHSEYMSELSAYARLVNGGDDSVSAKKERRRLAIRLWIWENKTDAQNR